MKFYLENWKVLSSCEELTVVQFELVEFVNCPSVDRAYLSTEQIYLYNICKTISSRHCPDDLALEKLGSVVHSRWLTSANRLLRLYIATENPNDDLITLATYIEVYAPVLFNIKTNAACSEGARHVWRMIQLSKYLQAELRTVVDAVIQRNAYFYHPEHLLLALLRDERSHIGELACRRNVTATQANTGTLARK